MRYDQKCTTGMVFIESAHYSCQILMKLEFSRQIFFFKFSKYQISWKSVQWNSNCSMRTDRRTWRNEQSLFAILQTRLKIGNVKEKRASQDGYLKRWWGFDMSLLNIMQRNTSVRHARLLSPDHSSCSTVPAFVLHLFRHRDRMDHGVAICLGHTNSVALVRERTIPTERPPPVGEVSTNFLRIEGCHVVSATDPHGR